MYESRNVLDALKSFAVAEDGTYDLLTHQPVEYTTGYQVSFVRPEDFGVLSCDEWDILTLYSCEYLQSNPHIGVYDGAAELSFHSLEPAKAENMMAEFNQESILDWKAKTEYPEDYIRWLIYNPNYDENKMVNYHEILKRI